MLAAPAVLAALDLAARLRIAGLLELNHGDARVAALHAALLPAPAGPLPGHSLQVLPEALKQRNVGLYNALHWTDVCLRALFETLEQEQRFDEHTLIVVTADHTPHPGVEYRAAVPAEEYVRLGRLPLIFAMRDAKRLAALDLQRLASQVDVAPTLLELVGMSKPRGMVGRSLIGKQPDGVALGVYRDTFY